MIGIGLTNGFAPLHAMPGWRGHIWWGYHADDGGFYDSNTYRSKSDTYGKGDVVGCGVDQRGGLFFTKNGKKLGEG